MSDQTRDYKIVAFSIEDRDLTFTPNDPRSPAKPKVQLQTLEGSIFFLNFTVLVPNVLRV